MRLSAIIFLLIGVMTQWDALCHGNEQKPFLIVGEELAPFEYLDEDGTPAGINVEIIDRIFKAMEVPYEIRFYPWARAWLMVQNGAADALLTVSYNPKREPFLYFTEEQKNYFNTGNIPADFLWLTEYVFFTHRRNASAIRFENYEQIKRDGLRVVVNDQYSYDERFLKSELATLSKSTPADAMCLLVDGKADLYPMDRAAGWALLQQHGWQEQVTWLPKPLFSKPYLLGFSRRSNYPDADDLMQAFYRRLRNLRQRGDVAEITAKHLSRVRPPRPARPLVFVGEDWAPFEYMKDGAVKGIDVDLVDRIMTTLQLAYEIRIYPWARAWKMAEEGQAEVVLSVSYHPKREDVLYYTEGQREASKTGDLPKDYLWLSRYGFFLKSQRAEQLKFNKYEDIIASNIKVGLNKGYSYFPDFPADKFNSHMYYDTESGFMGLVLNTIDLYPMDLTVGQYTLKEMGLANSIESLPWVLFSKAYLSPFVKKSDYPELESIMYEFYYELRQMRASGMLPY